MSASAKYSRPAPTKYKGIEDAMGRHSIRVRTPQDYASAYPEWTSAPPARPCQHHRTPLAPSGNVARDNVVLRWRAYPSKVFPGIHLERPEALRALSHTCRRFRSVFLAQSCERLEKLAKALARKLVKYSQFTTHRSLNIVVSVVLIGWSAETVFLRFFHCLSLLIHLETIQVLLIPSIFCKTRAGNNFTRLMPSPLDPALSGRIFLLYGCSSSTPITTFRPVVGPARQTLPTCAELGRPLRTGIDKVCRPQTKDSTDSTDPGRQSSTELSTGRQGLPTGLGNAVNAFDMVKCCPNTERLTVIGSISEHSWVQRHSIKDHARNLRTLTSLPVPSARVKELVECTPLLVQNLTPVRIRPSSPMPNLRKITLIANDEQASDLSHATEAFVRAAQAVLRGYASDMQGTHDVVRADTDTHDVPPSGSAPAVRHTGKRITRL
ncbi:hypothetical protein FB451DRAFT_1402513 [Mycena latifolia]|nr:hypothetical protein FB451DRAFT_1402513 [Mycena latifolia]